MKAAVGTTVVPRRRCCLAAVTVEIIASVAAASTLTEDITVMLTAINTAINSNRSNKNLGDLLLHWEDRDEGRRINRKEELEYLS